MQTVKNNTIPIFQILRRTFQLSTSVNKKVFHFILIMMFISSVIDLLTFAAIIPIIYLINDATPIQTNLILCAIYNFLNFSSSNAFILFLLIALIVVFLFKNLFSFFIIYLQNKFAFSIAEFLLDRQYTRYYNESFLHKKDKNAVDYLRYIATAPVQFSIDILLRSFYLIYDTFLVILVAITLLFYYPFVLVLVMLTIFPISFFLMRFARKRLAYYSTKFGKLEIESYQIGLEGINAYSDIKLFNKEHFFTKNIISVFSFLFKIHQKVFLFEALPRRIIEIIVILTIAVLYGVTVFLFKFVSSDLVLLLITFATAAYRLMPSINEILFNIIRIKSSAYVFEYLDTLKDSNTNEDVNSLSFNRQLSWQNVSYNYSLNEKPIVNEVSIDISKGSFIVITGDSGIGKTTLGNLFAGFILPQKGKYLIDDLPVKNFNQIKHLIACVSQDFFIFDKTLVENIAIGEPLDNINYNRINEILEVVNLADFVTMLADGLQYRVGENGVKLSGGQRQRLAIARALYKEAQILILDEITSALDKESEMEILETIYRISKQNNLTIIMITHRISSLKNFDKMYKMENASLILLK